MLTLPARAFWGFEFSSVRGTQFCDLILFAALVCGALSRSRSLAARRGAGLEGSLLLLVVLRTILMKDNTRKEIIKAQARSEGIGLEYGFAWQPRCGDWFGMWCCLAGARLGLEIPLKLGAVGCSRLAIGKTSLRQRS